LRRLYSTFASGWPGVGLLLMRVVLGGALVWRAGPALWNSGPTLATMATIFLAGCGILIVAGLWTPILCLFVCFGELWRCTFHLGDPTLALLMATISCALAMLGPGLWSIDARLFGWKRVEVPPRTLDRHTPESRS
jgi:putative oxidoreductase